MSSDEGIFDSLTHLSLPLVLLSSINVIENTSSRDRNCLVPPNVRVSRLKQIAILALNVVDLTCCYHLPSSRFILAVTLILVSTIRGGKLYSTTFSL